MSSKNRAATKRFVQQILEDAENKWGWRVVTVKRGWMLYPADKTKEIVTIHKTPGDHRAVQNILSRLRRSGAPV